MLHTKIIDTKDSKLSIQKAENFISSQDYGASIFFTGTVRNQNNDQIVTGITYDSHDELVIKSFEEIYDEANQKLNIKDKSVNLNLFLRLIPKTPDAHPRSRTLLYLISLFFSSDKNSRTSLLGFTE